MGKNIHFPYNQDFFYYHIPDKPSCFYKEMFWMDLFFVPLAQVKSRYIFNILHQKRRKI